MNLNNRDFPLTDHPPLIAKTTEGEKKISVNRPRMIAVLAMTVDGKISDYQYSSFRLGSVADKCHLEQQISQADGVLFGAGTLRAYGTTLTVRNPEYLQERQSLGKPLQPVQIVCSHSGNFALDLAFFSQLVPRWLLTGNCDLQAWEKDFPDAFEKVLVCASTPSAFSPLAREKCKPVGVNWQWALAKLGELGLEKLAVLGGGDLLGSLLTENLIDELWLTVCPYLVGGKNAPTAISGTGLLLSQARKLELKEVKKVGQELFLHYQCL